MSRLAVYYELFFKTEIPIKIKCYAEYRVEGVGLDVDVIWLGYATPRRKFL